MKLLSKNNTISKLLKLGVNKESLDEIAVLYENVFELSSEEKITPCQTDENIYLLHNGKALYKDKVYIVKKDVKSLNLIKENTDNLNSVNFTIEEFDTIFNLNSCKISDFGILIPLS